MPFWKPKKKKKAVHKAKPAKSLPKYEPKPFIPPEIPKIDISANVARNDLEKAGFNFQNHILFSAQDIEETVALMCYIQLSLLGVAGFVKVGNSLTDPIRNGDSLENYWFTPMYFSDIWHTRRIISQMMDILQEERESDDH